MDTHAFFLIMRNEMKLQMRSWVFRFFVVLSLVGIVACQMYRQGGDGMHIGKWWGSLVPFHW